jgi:protein-tyrosine phosphatase
MTQVTDSIFIGNIEHASNENWLRSRGITHIVNCAIEVRNFFPGKYEYLSLGFIDYPQSSVINTIDVASRFIEQATYRGGAVLVHCYAGVNRSSSTVIYHIMKMNNWDFSTAYHALHDIHPVANPSRVFRSQLKQLSISN